MLGVRGEPTKYAEIAERPYVRPCERGQSLEVISNLTFYFTDPNWAAVQ